jgi:hypothetical protein
MWHLLRTGHKTGQSTWAVDEWIYMCTMQVIIIFWLMKYINQKQVIIVMDWN